MSSAIMRVRCVVAGVAGKRLGPAVSVDLELPSEIWWTVKQLLRPFVGIVRPVDGAAVWRTIAEISEDDCSSPDLVPYGGNAGTAVRVGIDPERRLVRLVAAPRSRYLPVHAVRVVRTLLRLAAAGADPAGIFVHGGMFSHGGNGLAILGDKRSGKTSTVLAGVASGADFVSNDDLSVHPGAGGFVGVGWPRSVSVRIDTLSALGVRLPEQTTHPANSLFDIYQDDAKLLFPFEIADLFGSALVASAEVAGLVFPRFSTDPEVVLERLTPAEASSRIRGNLLYPPVKEDSLETHFTFPGSGEFAERADRIAAAVPAYELRQSLENVRAATNLLEKLLDERPA
jgi:hypothetical protein